MTEFWNPGNFCWWNPESWAVEFVIQLKEIRNPDRWQLELEQYTDPYGRKSDRKNKERKQK